VLFDGGVGRGGIPSLLNPPLVPRDHPAASYVDEYAAFAATDAGSVEARVVALVVEGTPIGIPHNILWWHEIVNLDVGGRRLVVTYCPLTGSSLVFDITGTALDRLGVSGLIFENNLVMFDEGTESLASARSGDLSSGTSSRRFTLWTCAGKRGRNDSLEGSS
jgi:hypothetical protein